VERLATRRLTGIAGLVAAVLFAVANSLWAFDQPLSGASGAKVVAFYRDTSGGIIAGGSLSVVAIAVFVFFASGMRSLLREHEGDDVLATAAFGGAIVMVTTGFAAETINMVGALRADAGDLTVGLAQAVFEISYVFGYYCAGAAIGVIALAVAGIALRGGRLMPKWTAILLAIFGIAFLTPLSRWLLAPAVLVLVVVSIGMLRAPATEMP
jgi:hypothetical protein